MPRRAIFRGGAAAGGYLFDALGAVESSLRDAGFRTIPADSPLRPSFIGVHPELGVVAVDVVSGRPDARVQLNRKVAQLRQDVEELATASIARRIVDTELRESFEISYAARDIESGEWLTGLEPQPISEELSMLIVEKSAPILSFVPSHRGAMTDEGAEARAADRLTLDIEQASVAQEECGGVVVISGAPGSGKTLVLAARARWMATNHPEWRVQVLCYNRLLVPYLRSLVAEFSNIEVNTFGKFAFSHGIRVSLRSEEEAASDLPVAIAKASPVVDALLIDEWQDFFPSWLRLLQEMLFPGRGGLTLAGDPEQALYRDGGVLPEVRGVRHVQLRRSYRSTRQIMQVACTLDGDVEATATSDAPEGEPVDLVWAGDPREQADSIARDIGMILEAGTRPLSQIAVLYTRRWQVGALVGALKAVGIPFHVANPKEADSFKLAREEVKLITVHSSKGYEFDVVFLAGLELLPDPDGSEENQRVGRIGYVGASRARDQLVITYSRENEYLMRIRQLPEDIMRRWVWPEDYPEV